MLCHFLEVADSRIPLLPLRGDFFFGLSSINTVKSVFDVVFRAGPIPVSPLLTPIAVGIL